MTKAEKKRELRTAVRRAERELTASYRTRSDGAICARVTTMPEFLSAGTVFCFVGTAGEIDTRPILTAALRAGQTLCVPLCTGNGLMELRRIDSLEQLSPGFHGIPEPPPAAGAINPDDVDFTVIPCAACDRVGHRLGKGGGYYDRFLAAYRGPAVLVCRERLLWDEIPMEPHDAVVPWVVTERALYEDGVPARTE